MRVACQKKTMGQSVATKNLAIRWQKLQQGKTLREAAKAQAQQLGPTGLENLGQGNKENEAESPRSQMGGLVNSSKIWMKPVFKG